MLKIGDIILVIFFSAIAIGGILKINASKTAGNIVLLKENSKEIASYDLSKDNEYLITSENFNIKIKVFENKVSIIEADCPDKVCVRTGEIKYSGDIITCLPNKIVVEIKKEIEDNPVDSIAW